MKAIRGFVAFRVLFPLSRGINVVGSWVYSVAYRVSP